MQFLFSYLDPMEYFILDAITGELRTARPLDKEAVDNPQGILTLNIKVRFIATFVCREQPRACSLKFASF